MLIQCGRKMTCRMRLTPCRKPDRRFAEPLLPSGLGFASRGGLQQAQTLATDLFRVLTAFSLILELQARPLTGAQGLEVEPSEATIERWLWRKQGTLGTTHLCLKTCWRCRSGVIWLGP
jgi:hypothetical protein